jgi:hypothetical protein
MTDFAQNRRKHGRYSRVVLTEDGARLILPLVVFNCDAVRLQCPR